MKYVFVFFVLMAALSSCNTPIEVVPGKSASVKQDTVRIITRDTVYIIRKDTVRIIDTVYIRPDTTNTEFNLLLIPTSFKMDTLPGGSPLVELELYLRQLHFNPDTNYYLQFESEQFGYFEFNRDNYIEQLLPGDKILFTYQLFRNYRLKGRFITKYSGNHTLTFRVWDEKFSKITSITFKI